MPKQKKPKVAIVSLTCCDGCEFAILDLGQKFLALTKRVDLVHFRLFQEDYNLKGPFDICFVEGSVVTKENLKVLKKLRRVSKKLIILGNCAHTGGVHKMKNWVGRIKALGLVYKYPKGLANPPVEAISEIVKVDFIIPGCPINGEEFLQIVYQLLAGKRPQIRQNPVCYECQIKGYPCLLQEGEICLGPVTLGGCQAICLKSRQPCWGCRGLLEEPDVFKFVKMLSQNHTLKEIIDVLEVFGLKDEWAKQSEKEYLATKTPTELMVVKRTVQKPPPKSLLVIKSRKRK